MGKQKELSYTLYKHCTVEQRATIEDDSYLVRVEAAKLKIAPDVTINDSNEFVRMMTVLNSPEYLQKAKVVMSENEGLFNRKIKRGVSLMVKSMSDPSPSVRRATAQACKDSQLKYLYNDPDDGVTIEIIKRSSKKVCAELIEKGDESLWLFLAEHAAALSYDELVRKNSKDVKMIIAERGEASHRDVLVRDPDVDIRMAVARFGGNRHREVLQNDTCEEVRAEVVKFGDERQWRHLEKDSSDEVKVQLVLKEHRLDLFFDDADEMISSLARDVKYSQGSLMH